MMVDAITQSLLRGTTVEIAGLIKLLQEELERRKKAALKDKEGP